MVSIAKKMGCSSTKVRKFLQDEKIPLRSRWDWCVKKVPIEEIKALYLNGMTTQDIAKKFDVHAKTIIRNLKEAGCFDKGRRYNRRSIDTKALKKMLRSGMTNKEIAKTLDIGEMTLYRRLKKLNIKREHAPGRVSKSLRGRPRINMPELEEMKALYLARISINKLSKKFKYSDEIIKKRFIELGIPIRGWHVKSNSELPNLEEMKALYSQGWSLYRLGKKYQISEETIIKRFVDMGITIRGRHDPIYRIMRGKPRKKLPIEEIKRLYHDGMGIKSISEKFNVHLNTIRNRLKEIGALNRDK